MNSSTNKTLWKALPFALAGACLLWAADVSVDYDHKADFSQYRTYSWLKVEATDPLWNDRISSAIDSQLTGKGWSKVPSGGDAAVAAIGGVHNQEQLDTFYNGFGGRWGWRGFGEATTTVENVRVGTLMVDIFDGHTQKLIFRATGSNALSGKPEKNEEKLNKTVADIFKHFPPPPKG
jgi:hypothetical protein